MLAWNIALKLKEQQYPIWIDCYNLSPNLPISPQLKQAIFKSNLFLLIDSPSIKFSAWVQYELHLQSIVNNTLIKYSYLEKLIARKALLNTSRNYA